MMKYRIELKSWSIYFATLLIACFIHEIGHSLPAWLHGYVAIPTPAKQYIPPNIPIGIQEGISFGGLAGTILFAFSVLISALIIKTQFNWAILAGAIATPGFYSLRFILFGRGHDATEFQEAQSFLGFSYSGHLLDWIFLFIFILGILVWIYKCRPNYKITGRILIGFILTIIFIMGLQTLNNLLFDPILQKFHLS
jgi:hypothetical protein